MKKDNFIEGICPITGKKDLLIKGRNPLIPPIGLTQVMKTLDAEKIEDVDLFCRTLDIPFDPNLWIKIVAEDKGNPFYEYTNLICQEDGTYKIENKNTWLATTKEWARIRKQRDIINNIDPIKRAYEQRAGLIWGMQYSFTELVELDSLYTQSLQANNITNPLQKKSLKTILKIMIDMDKAILNHDSSELKSLTSAFKTLATTAQLDEMIDNTKTEDLTTLAELVEFIENSGFEMPFYDGRDKDAIDMAISNIQESNARLVRDATGLGPLLEDLTQKYKEQKEKKAEEKAFEAIPFEEVAKRYTDNTAGLDIEAEDDLFAATESDDEIVGQKFEEE